MFICTFFLMVWLTCEMDILQPVWVVQTFSKLGITLPLLCPPTAIFKPSGISSYSYHLFSRLVSSCRYGIRALEVSNEGFSKSFRSYLPLPFLDCGQNEKTYTVFQRSTISYVCLWLTWIFLLCLLSIIYCGGEMLLFITWSMTSIHIIIG